MQTVIDNHELVMVVPIKPLLVSNVLQRHVTKLHPWLQHLHHLLIDPTRIVYHEMRSGSEQSHMVSPFPHPLGAQAPVQRRSTVQIVVLRLGAENGGVQASGGLRQSLNPVGEVEVPVTGAGGGGGEGDGEGDDDGDGDGDGDEEEETTTSFWSRDIGKEEEETRSLVVVVGVATLEMQTRRSEVEMVKREGRN
ncbi:LOW QUALITY PROTEIN: hypothetical protein PanWU01x14_265070 [Parasponia andersonii]|uniref:Uncharacterized protein n=1 Tax=Parasponia andersonii TaxID=3476 RepID=A0A2P5B738_PARAD|nr:LOW QUALITY PROTEIN: hypothetical protein PanWU01x14_265070 [Parasponia andersonii]